MLVAQCGICKRLIEVEQEQKTVRCVCCDLVQNIERIGEICPSEEEINLLKTLHAIVSRTRCTAEKVPNVPASDHRTR
jgi:hypothetical protein